MFASSVQLRGSKQSHCLEITWLREEYEFPIFWLDKEDPGCTESTEEIKLVGDLGSKLHKFFH